MSRTNSVGGSLGVVVTLANLVFAIFFVTFGTFSADCAYADNLAAAQNNLNQSYAKFYQTLMANPGASVDDARKLNQEIIAPAAAQVSNAVRENFDQTLRSMGVVQVSSQAELDQVFAESRARSERGEIRTMQQVISSEAAGGSSGGLVNTGYSGTGGGVSSLQENPKTVIDGSHIQKVIEFGQDRKPASDTRN